MCTLDDRVSSPYGSSKPLAHVKISLPALNVAFLEAYVEICQSKRSRPPRLPIGSV
jgi:hypothetical protein